MLFNSAEGGFYHSVQWCGWISCQRGKCSKKYNQCGEKVYNEILFNYIIKFIPLEYHKEHNTLDKIDAFSSF